ncbi:MAG: hypothetical protein JSS96_13355 [Bacteroidetes bacterium]|nr:hypothetical protein [Bacteroidota bacterium]
MMKKLFLPVAVLIALVSLSSCSENFDVAAPYKSITVIYGLMDQGDTAHYVRIEKAFLDQNKSAVDMAKNPDSIYFSKLDVRVDVLNNNSVVGSIPLTKVDLTNEGYPRDAGSFATTPNYAYKFKNYLDPNNTYRLVVHNPVTGQTDSAEADVISEDLSTYNIPFFATSNSAFAIQRTAPNFTVNLGGSSLPAAVKTIQGIIRFHWVDRDASGGETDKYADWPFANQLITSQSFLFKINNVDFYYAMRNAIGPAPTGITRLIDSCDIFLYMGSSDFYTYQQIAATQNSGLTSGEILPNYTNIKGTNVLGLFTSRGVVKDLNVPFNNESLDSLMVNPITQSLLIKGRSDH